MIGRLQRIAIANINMASDKVDIEDASDAEDEKSGISIPMSIERGNSSEIVRISRQFSIVRQASSRLMETDEDMTMCRICFSPIDRVEDRTLSIRLGCTCLIHLGCLNQYIRSKESEVWVKNGGIPCPYGKECPHSGEYFLEPMDVQKLVNYEHRMPAAIKGEMEMTELVTQETVDNIQRWIDEGKEYMKQVDETTDSFIMLTTKPCPSCGFRATHFHGHACHHISPYGGCANCRTEFCYVCLSTKEENIARPGNPGIPGVDWFCKCPIQNWSTYCDRRDLEKHISWETGYPLDTRCGCVICPECRFGKPCSNCEGSCCVCVGLVPPGPLSLDEKKASVYREKVQRIKAQAFKDAGNKSYEKKNYTDAIDKYTKGIEMDPKDVTLYSNRSAAYAKIFDWYRSFEDGQMCILVDPTFAKGYLRAAFAQVKLGDLPGARATATEGIKVDGGNEQLLGLFQQIKSEILGSRIANLNMAIAEASIADESDSSKNKNKAALHFKRAKAYTEKRNWSGAIEDYLQVLSLDPDFDITLYAELKEEISSGLDVVGKEHLIGMRYILASEVFTDRIAFNENAVAYACRAQCHLSLLSWEDAIIDGQKSLELDGSVQNIRSYVHVCTAQFSLGEYSDAERTAEAGLALAPQCLELLEIQRDLQAHRQYIATIQEMARIPFDGLGSGTTHTHTIDRVEKFLEAKRIRSSRESGDSDMSMNANQMQFSLFPPILIQKNMPKSANACATEGMAVDAASISIGDVLLYVKDSPAKHATVKSVHDSTFYTLSYKNDNGEMVERQTTLKFLRSLPPTPPSLIYDSMMCKRDLIVALKENPTDLNLRRLVFSHDEGKDDVKDCVGMGLTIDIGTTNIRAKYANGDPVLINGKDTMLNTIGLADSGEWVVGLNQLEAMSRGVRASNFIENSIMCMSLVDDLDFVFRNHVKQGLFAFDVVPGSHGRALIKLNRKNAATTLDAEAGAGAEGSGGDDGSTILLRPEEILSLVLKIIRKAAEQVLQWPVTNCTLVMPLIVNSSTKLLGLNTATCIQNAAHAARMRPIRVFSACHGILNSCPDNIRFSNEPLVVLDIGTIGVRAAVISSEQKVLEEISVTSDGSIGGKDFDAALLTHFIDEIRNKYDIDLKFDKRKSLVRAACERVRYEFSKPAIMEASIRLTDFLSPTEVDDMFSYCTVGKFGELRGLKSHSELNGKKIYVLSDTMGKLNVQLADTKQIVATKLKNVIIDDTIPRVDETICRTNFESIRLLRGEFAKLCSMLLKNYVAVIRGVMQAIRRPVESLKHVVLGGGCAQMLLIRDYMRAALPGVEVVIAHPAAALNGVHEYISVKPAEFDSLFISMMKSTYSLESLKVGQVFQNITLRNQVVPTCVQSMLTLTSAHHAESGIVLRISAMNAAVGTITITGAPSNAQLRVSLQSSTSFNDVMVNINAYALPLTAFFKDLLTTEELNELALINEDDKSIDEWARGARARAKAKAGLDEFEDFSEPAMNSLPRPASAAASTTLFSEPAVNSLPRPASSAASMALAAGGAGSSDKLTSPSDPRRSHSGFADQGKLPNRTIPWNVIAGSAKYDMTNQQLVALRGSEQAPPALHVSTHPHRMVWSYDSMHSQKWRCGSEPAAGTAGTGAGEASGANGAEVISSTSLSSHSKRKSRGCAQYCKARPGPVGEGWVCKAGREGGTFVGETKKEHWAVYSCFACNYHLCWGCMQMHAIKSNGKESGEHP